MELQTHTSNEEAFTSDLAARLDSRDETIRRAAEESLKSWDRDSVTALLEIAQRENNKKPLRFGLAMAGFVVSWVLVVAVLEILFDMNIGGAIGGLTVVGLGFAAAVAPTRLQKRVVKLLSEVDDVRAVPALVEALERQDTPSKKAAASALVRLLPRLTTEHDNLLDTRQRRLVFGGMSDGLQGIDKASDVEFAHAALTMLENVPDHEAYTAVRKLADSKGLARKQPEIRSRAERLLPILGRAREKARVGQTLLRPASSQAENDLLRPAASSQGPTEESLLRPTGQE